MSGRSSVAEAVLTRPRVAILADTPAQQARAVIKLLEDRQEAERIGQAAHQRIAEHYLITHYLSGYLRLFSQVRRQHRGRKGS